MSNDDECLCHDCGIDTLPLDYGARSEFYMVTPEVWRQAAPDDTHDMTLFLCIGCLEARLGRRLVKTDFTDAKLNDVQLSDIDRWAWSYRTPRLVNRLTSDGGLAAHL